MPRVLGTSFRATKPIFNIYIRIADDYEGKDAFDPDDRQLGIVWTPDSISDNAQANWNATAIIGRSEPWQAFANTGARQISFPLIFQAEEDPYEEVVRPTNWLRALQYPVYNEGIVYRPPILMVVWGQLFKGGIRCFCNQASVTWQKPFEADETLYPHRSEVSLGFTKVSPIPLGAPDIMKGY